MPRTGSAPQGAGHPTCRLRIALSEVDPTIWRRLIVPADVRLSKLADVLLVAMGWSNSHMHQFRIGDALYGMHLEDWDKDELDEKRVSVVEALGDEDAFWFDYDLGDGWEHPVEVEARSSLDLGLKFAVCIGGERACPPDDVGGPGGYESFLEAIADPNHAEHEEFLEWVGGTFDPDAFDLVGVNAALQRLR